MQQCICWPYFEYLAGQWIMKIHICLKTKNGLSCSLKRVAGTGRELNVKNVQYNKWIMKYEVTTSHRHTGAQTYYLEALLYIK
jgi:hypothetical protein